MLLSKTKLRESDKKEAFIKKAGPEYKLARISHRVSLRKEVNGFPPQSVGGSSIDARHVSEKIEGVFNIRQGV